MKHEDAWTAARTFGLAVVLAAAACGQDTGALPGIGGPSVIGRGAGTVGRRGGEPVSMRVFGHVNGAYDSGLTAVTLNDRGEIPTQALYGVEGGVGAYGIKSWRHTSVGLDYRGSYRHYSAETFFNGTDHFLQLQVERQLSKRATIAFREVAGTTTRAAGAFLMSGVADPTLIGVPFNELFDNRTDFLQSSVDLTLHKGARLSVNLSGTGYIVRRRSDALFGLNGYQARGDVAYRLNRRQTLFADYSFMHFDYPGAFGASDLHDAGIGWSVQLGRRWQFALRAGAFRTESLGSRRVEIDPVIAAIIGRTEGLQAFYRLNYLPSGNATLLRQFQRAQFSATYSRGANPGNGIYMTSSMQTATASVSYTGVRHINIGVAGGWTGMRGLAQVEGAYRSYYGGGGFTWQLARGVSFITRVDARQSDLDASLLVRKNAVRAVVGFAFSTGDGPLSLW